MKKQWKVLMLLLIVSSGIANAQKDALVKEPEVGAHDGFQCAFFGGTGRMYATTDMFWAHYYFRAALQISTRNSMSVFDFLLATPRLAVGAGVYPDALNEPSNYGNVPFLLADIGCAIHLGEHAYVPFGFTYQHLLGEERIALHVSAGTTTYWWPTTVSGRSFVYFGYGYKFERFFWELALNVDVTPAIWTVLDHPYREAWKQNDRKFLLDLKIGYDL